MRRIAPLLTAALLAGLLTLFASPKAEAGATFVHTNSAPAITTGDSLLTPVGYYSDYRQKSDDYRDEGGDEGYGEERRGDRYGDDDGNYGYGYKRHHDNYCGTHYEKKYVCDQTEPRCFRQRECVWEYGREYCRYVRKCVGGERYCKWVKYPVSDCGYRY